MTSSAATAASTVRTIGFRASPSSVSWAVVDGPKEQPRVEGADTLEAPKTYSDAQKLAWYAKRVDELCRTKFDPRPMSAWIRTAETVGKHRLAHVVPRCRIEGLIIATATALGLSVEMGALGTITAQVKPSKTASGSKKTAKTYLDQEHFRGIDWAEYSDNEREAILVAVAALP